jgi:hypothetical protein
MCTGFILVSMGVLLVATWRLAFALYVHDLDLVVRFVLISIASGIAPWLFYKLAIHNAEVWWGEVFKSGYDLYLPALAEKMGYETPAEPARRRKFWKKVGWQFRYHEEIDLSEYAKKSAGDNARAEPEQSEEAEESAENEMRKSSESEFREPKQ